ncbi:MAG: DNA adenine methylase [Bacteroides sp.]|nr:DNA adenine methylase [Bacteroides sp.]MCM1550538.1 DNA adenine methylase [Clostridium sp.]
MKPILKYPGAKNRMAPWICSRIPEHEVYLEPYFGSGAVFFNKIPSRIETINDLDDSVVNFFHVLREYPDELTAKLELTPYARKEYEDAFIVNENDDIIELARKFAVKCWMGFGCSNRYRNGFRTSQQRTSPDTTKQWHDFISVIPLVTERLQNAQIEKKPAMELLDMYDTKDVFIYLDPPYLPDIRKKYQYVHEMSYEGHVELLEKILKHPGKVMISGYESDLYKRMLKGWSFESRLTRAERGVERREFIWMNYN